MRMVQIKQAEVALSAGRLEEARDLICSEEIRSHRRGQALLDRLIEAYMARCEEHLHAGRGKEALEDCTQAELLAGASPRVSDLRRRVQRHLVHSQDGRVHLARVLAQARDHIAQGRLTLAEGLLSGSSGPSDPAIAELEQRLAASRAAAGSHLEAFRDRLERDDLLGAARALSKAEAICRSWAKVQEAKADFLARVQDLSQKALAAGRLDRAALLLEAAKGLCPDASCLDEVFRILDHCRRAHRWLERGEHQRAAESLQLVRTLLGRTNWLEEALTQAQRAAKACQALRTGPLALLDETRDPPGDPLRAAPAQGAPRPAAHPAEPARLERFCLQVDGGGCYLVLRGDQVRLGPVGSDTRPDVGLMLGAHVADVTLCRSEGDYVLRCDQPVRINGRGLKEAALCDGDKIELSPRCRLRFRQPNAASGTAVLEADNVRLAQQGATAAILMDRELVLGPGAKSHIKTALLESRAVITAGQEGLHCRCELEMTEAATQQPTDAIRPDRPVRIGPVGLVMTKATA